MENRSEKDNELADRSRVGDMSAFRALVDGHREKVISIAWRISGDFHAAEDLAQEAFVKAFEKLKEFDPGKGAFSSWLYAIAKNHALNARRKIIPIPVESSENESCQRPSPAETSERRDQFRLLEEAIEKLEEPFRTAFLLGEVEELPLDQVSEVEGVPVGTVKSRVSRARARLRKILGNSQPTEA